MRNNYLLPALIALMLLSCKKDTKEITDTQPVASTNDYTLCYGTNTWENNVTYVGDRPTAQAVYDGKVYYFHNDFPNPNDPFRNKITIYDGTSWQVLSSAIPMEPLYCGFTFVIGNKAYLGYTPYVGSNSHGNSWVYNFTTNTWAETESFPGYYLQGPAFFTIGNKGYIVGGYKNGSYTNETWEFDSGASPKWRKRANYPGTARSSAEGFSIGNKGYIVNGRTIIQNPYEEVYYKTLLEYNPSTNTWATKADFPGTSRAGSESFVIAGNAYVGGGYKDEANYVSFYKYDPVDNDWIAIPNYSTTAGYLTSCFALDNKGYAVWRPNHSEPYRLKKYNPVICATIQGGPFVP
jgi:hypothetical protein